MKKILSFIAASTVALTLASCFGGGDSNNNGSSQKPASGITDQSQDLIKRADGTVIS